MDEKTKQKAIDCIDKARECIADAREMLGAENPEDCEGPLRLSGDKLWDAQLDLDEAEGHVNDVE